MSSTAAPAPGVVARSGATRFARFAYPPNALGLCGPDDSRAVLEYAAAGVVDAGLVELARGFEGAWPYLELIAGANGIADALDAAVVEAYWVGNALSGRVGLAELGRDLETRFRGRAGVAWERIVAAMTSGVTVCHGFHVFAVYPWVGLLRSGAGGHALDVLDRCRIRWGTVVCTDAVSGTAVVRSRRLRFDGARLTLGAAEPETVTIARDGYGFVADLAPGTTVALHWDWICETLTPAAAARLRADTATLLRLARL